MKKLNETFQKVIDLHKQSLLDAHAEFKGVYIHFLFDEDYVDLEVEVNEGTIAFTHRVKDACCVNCTGEKFLASEMVSFEVTCNGHRDVLKREAEVSGEGVQGPYTCKSCGEIYESTNDLFNQAESVGEVLTEVLKMNGIGVYPDRDSWEKALEEDL